MCIAQSNEGVILKKEGDKKNNNPKSPETKVHRKREERRELARLRNWLGRTTSKKDFAAHRGH